MGSKAMTQKLLMPLQELPLDQNGWRCHPDLPQFEEGQEQDFGKYLRQQGLRYALHSLENDTSPENDKIATDYFEHGSSDFSGWNPLPPQGDGWFLISIHDTEDGPVAMWVTREPEQSA